MIKENKDTFDILINYLIHSFPYGTLLVYMVHRGGEAVNKESGWFVSGKPISQSSGHNGCFPGTEVQGERKNRQLWLSRASESSVKDSVNFLRGLHCPSLAISTIRSLTCDFNEGPERKRQTCFVDARIARFRTSESCFIRRNRAEEPALSIAGRSLEPR